MFKTEFVYARNRSIRYELIKYVNWLNTCRIHCLFNYLTPVEIIKTFQIIVDNPEWLKDNVWKVEE